jgi:hypothetical protein
MLAGAMQHRWWEAHTMTPRTTTTTTTTTRMTTRAADIDDGDMTDDGADLGAHSALGVEPLTTDEIADVTARADDVDEVLEGGLEALRKETEMKLPGDPDAADGQVSANDAELDVRMRPARKR